MDTKIKNNEGSTALEAAKQNTLVRSFDDYEMALQAVKQNRAKLANVMTTRNVEPVELTYHYIKRYNANHKLGSGAFGDVLLAEDNDLPEPKKFAVKMMKLSQRTDAPNDDDLKSFTKELSVRCLFGIESTNNGPISLEF